MHDVSRRSAMALAAAATTALAARAGSALAQGSALKPDQGQLPKGVTRKVLGKRSAMLPDYKNVQMIDLVYEPGAKTDNASMPSDMVCHVPQGELRIKKSDGMEFTATEESVVQMTLALAGGELKQAAYAKWLSKNSRAS